VLILTSAGVFLLSREQNTVSTNQATASKNETQALILQIPDKENGTAASQNFKSLNNISTNKGSAQHRSGLVSSIGEALANLNNKSVAATIRESEAEIKDAMTGLSLRPQDLAITASNSPLGAQKIDRHKPNRSFQKRDGGTWTSLLLNIWDNPAYTGAGGKLTLSYDDKMSFFDYWRGGIYRDHFAVDGRIPKTPFNVGVYHDRALNAYSMKTGTAFTLSARTIRLGSGYLVLGGGVSALTKRFYRNTQHYSEPVEMTFGLKEVSKERTFTSRSTALSLEAGAWYQAKNMIAGVALKNANEPLFGYAESGEHLNRSWHFTGGYRIEVGKLQILPMLEVERNKLFSQASASIMTTFDDKITLGAAYQNISPVTQRGDKVAYAGIKAFNRLTLFTSYGRNGEMAAKGINRHIVHTGLRFQFSK
jgi:hypothetical protein